MILICKYILQENRVHMTFMPPPRGVLEIVEIFIHEKGESISRLARDSSASFIYTHVSNKRLYKTKRKFFLKTTCIQLLFQVFQKIMICWKCLLMWYRLHCLYINGTLHKSGLNGLKHGHVVSRCLLHFNLDIKNPKNYSKIKIKKYAFEITGTKIGIKKKSSANK